ncbi:transposase InsO family protein [Lysinibacillus sp. TE18511]
MKKELNKQPKQAPIEGSTEALQARIKQLEMENEYLKKLNALCRSKKRDQNDSCRTRRSLWYRRIRDELANRGQKVNHKKVQRIMKELGLKCIVRMKKYKSYKGTVGKIAPNILDRNFTSEAPNEKWVTDITEFELFGKNFIYCLF